MIRRSEISNYNHLAKKTVTSSYTVLPADEVILVDCTAAAVTITLPDAVGNSNLLLRIKKIDSSGNAVTIATSNSQTIDGASTVTISTQWQTSAVLSDGTNWQTLSILAGGSTFNGGSITTALTVNVASATAFNVGPNGTTNPTFQVVTNTASAATGIKITSAAAAAGVAIAVISSGTNENMTLDAKGSGTITIAGLSTGNVQVGGASSNPSFIVDSNNAAALVVGANGGTNPVLQVDASTASTATGISITGAAAGTSPNLAVISSGSNEGLQISPKGTGGVHIVPGSNSQTTFDVRKSDGTTIVLQVDTTNSRLAIGGQTTNPTYTLDIFPANVAAATSLAIRTNGSDTLTGNVTDAFTGAIAIHPTIAGAFTATRMNYIDLNNPAGAATVTNACALRFDAAAGTHKAVDAATTKTTPSGVDAWVKINLNGTLAYMPAYLSKTA